MRIVMLNAYAHETGGADKHCLELGEELAFRRHEVAFLATASERNVVNRGRFVKCHVTNETRDDLPPMKRVEVAARAIWNPEAASAMRDLLREFRPDVVHVHNIYPQLSVAPVRVARKAGVPIVQTLHDYEFISAGWRDHSGSRWDRDEATRAYRALNNLTFPVRRHAHVPSVSTWIAVSRYMGEVHAGRGIGATVLPNFTTTGTGPVTGFADRHGAVFISRLVPEKGVSHVIHAARRLPELSVTIAGGGELAPEVQQASEELDNLSYVGVASRQEVGGLLRSARVALAPSLWQEPASLSALEAMSCGTPVVAYASGALPEYVGGPGAGKVVSPGADNLADACVELHGDRSAWVGCSARAVAAVREQHHLGYYVDQLEDIYQRVGRTDREDHTHLYS